MKLFKRDLWENRINNKILIGKDNCPFCIHDGEEKQYIIFETKYWSIRYNKYPYYGKEKHIMAIPLKHREYTYDLNKEELKDYKNIEIFIKKYYAGEEYFSIIRQSLGNRSIKHLHYHYLTGKISYKEIEGEDFFKIKK